MKESAGEGDPARSEAGPRARHSAQRGTRRGVAQAWIETISEYPEAVSAFGVARRALGTTGLQSLRRARLIELEGALPPAAEVAERLHGSTRFYNPNKERCHLRMTDADPAPLEPGERAVLVFDRGGERREAAERWWKRATGTPVRVREGTAWIVAATAPGEGDAMIEGLIELKDARHGLLCNPHAQEYRRAGDPVPLAWFASGAKPREGKR
ncbi:MAG: hypothetical protein ABIS67_07195 [Candidatus Eisenbacteria bacterium]